MTHIERTIEATDKKYNEYSEYLLKTKEKLMEFVEFEFELVHLEEGFVIMNLNWDAATVKDCMQIIDRDGVLTEEQFDLLTI